MKKYLYTKERSLTIKFIKKILKNGNKYKYYKIYKNFWTFFKILRNNWKRKIRINKTKNGLIISKERFELIIGFYSINIALKYIKKKKRKRFISSLLEEKKKNLEILKIWRLFLFKTKIRTFKLRLYYLLISFILQRYFMIKFNKRAKRIYKISKKYIKIKKKNNFNKIFFRLNIWVKV